ncbi:hypothetical protein [Streptomyces cinereoruber]|uniref:hypothetical protein n=1 Tax=Streptomyces cinereoruber TaxID=67260 RepID=UPI0036369FA4
MKERPARSLVLDSEALSLLLRNDRGMAARIEAGRSSCPRACADLVVVLTSDRDDWSKLCGKRVIIRDV